MRIKKSKDVIDTKKDIFCDFFREDACDDIENRVQKVSHNLYKLDYPNSPIYLVVDKYSIIYPNRYKELKLIGTYKNHYIYYADINVSEL